MGKLQPRHLIETGLWLTVVLFFWYHSLAFEREIEIYRYGASTWPRGILLLMALVALTQLLHYWLHGDQIGASAMASIMHDSAESGTDEHSTPGWYLSTLLLVALPFIYMNLPQILAGTTKPGDPGLHQWKLICAAALIIIYLPLMWRNHVGGILALPLLFAAMLQDLGFYALAPFFIIGVMFLMGERRIRPFTWVMPLIMGLLLLFFVSLLYVGLPTGNIRPFYDFGTWIVTLLQ